MTLPPDSLAPMGRVALELGLVAVAVLLALRLRRAMLALAEEHAQHQATSLPGKGAARPPRRDLWAQGLPWVVAIGGVLLVLDRAGAWRSGALSAAVRQALTTGVSVGGGLELTLGHVVVVLVLLGLAGWASTWAQRGVRRAMQADAQARDGVTASVQRLVHYGIMATAMVIAVRSIGLDLSGLFAAGAVFAVGIGFGLQALTQNFVSGLILLVERTIKPGDVLLVDGRLVRVLRMGIRTTIGQTLDDDQLILPNGKLLDNFVVNYHLDSEVVRARATVGVSYDSDVDEVLRVLEACARAFPDRVPQRDPVVLFRGFGDSTLDFEVSIWIEDAFRRDVLLSRLRVAMWRALRDAHIEIAFPQLDVHLDVPLPAPSGPPS